MKLLIIVISALLIFLGLFGLSYLLGWAVVWLLHTLFETPYITTWWKRILIGAIVNLIFGGLKSNVDGD